MAGMRLHYAEADNELHHLLIMEALGGSEAFVDRFVTQHLAFVYSCCSSPSPSPSPEP